MKTPGYRAFLTSSALLCLTLPGTLAFGFHGRAAVYEQVETVLPVETSYTLPVAVEATSYVVPTVSYVPTSYVAPTSYVYPTSYLTTSYSLPSLYTTSYSSPSYVASSYVVPTSYSYSYTSYRRPWRFFSPRRLFQRTNYVTATSLYVPSSVSYVPSAYYTSSSYVPTSYVYPTIYDAPVVATVAMNDTCCSGSAIASPPRASAPIASPPRSSAPTIQSSPSNSSNEREPAATREPSRTPSSAVDSSVPEPTERPEVSAPEPRPLQEPTQETPTPPRTTAPPPEASTTPLPEPEEIPLPTNNLGMDKGGIPSELPQPVPADGGIAPPDAPGDDDLPRRIAKRPAFGDLQVERSKLNLLEGRVISGDSGGLEEGVEVILSSRTNAFVDRVARTNAKGRYRVQLPDGDWTVKVVMPSGRSYVVSQLTVSAGNIVDSLGRDIPSLTITR